MHGTVRVVFAVLALVTGARVGLAKCDPSVDPDRADVANARAAVAAACDCARVATDDIYVRCAIDVASRTLVNKACAGAVKHCESKSTCGRPGFVACCRTRKSGTTSCTLKRSADRCVAPKGGGACVGSFPSCCDACTSSDCATSTTSTTTTTSTPPITAPACSTFNAPCGSGGNCVCTHRCDRGDVLQCVGPGTGDACLTTADCPLGMTCAAVVVPSDCLNARAFCVTPCP